MPPAEAKAFFFEPAGDRVVEMSLLKSIASVVASSPKDYEPNRQIDDIFKIDRDFLRENAITHLVFDIDQTIGHQGVLEPHDDVVSHLKMIGDILKGKVCFLTNEPSTKRTEILRKLTGFQVISGPFRKPNAEAYKAALEHLKIGASKHVAAVGDRIWTDVLGANQSNLFSILVNPQNPSEDRFWAGIAREMERHSSSRFELLSWLGSIASISGINLLSIVYTIAVVWGIFIKYDTLDLLVEYKSLVACAIGLFYVSYLYYVHLEKSKHRLPSGNIITEYFNTYPLLIRVLASIMMILFFELNIIDNADIIKVGLMFCLFNVFLISLSLLSIYHRTSSRLIRIILDASLIVIIATALEGSYKLIPLAFLCIPIATASRYFDTLAMVVTVFGSLLILVYFIIEIGFDTQLSVTIGFFIAGAYCFTAMILYLEHEDFFSPFISMYSKYADFHQQRGTVVDFLERATKIVKCSGMLLVRLDDRGSFYIREGDESSGNLANRTVEELSNFLNFHHTHWLTGDDSAQYKIDIHSKRMAEMERFMMPPLKNGIIAAMAIEVPLIEHTFMIAINPLSRNGTIRSQFSRNHLIIMRMMALLVSASYKPYINQDSIA